MADEYRNKPLVHIWSGQVEWFPLVRREREEWRAYTGVQLKHNGEPKKDSGSAPVGALRYYSGKMLNGELGFLDPGREKQAHELRMMIERMRNLIRDHEYRLLALYEEN